MMTSKERMNDDEWKAKVTADVLADSAARRNAKAAERAAAKIAAEIAKAERAAAKAAAVVPPAKNIRRPRARRDVPRKPRVRKPRVPKVPFATMVAGARIASADERKIFEGMFGLPSDPLREQLRCYGSLDEPHRLAFLIEVVDGAGAPLGLWRLTGSRIGRNGLLVPKLTEEQMDDMGSPLLCPVGIAETAALAAYGYCVVGRTNDSVACRRHLAKWLRVNNFYRPNRFSRGGRRAARPIVTFSAGAAAMLFGRFRPRDDG
jgi:hypothetical protein